MRQTTKRRPRKESMTAGPSGMEFKGHTPDGPIWEKRGGQRNRAGIDPSQADQSMVERNIPIDWELRLRLKRESARWERKHGRRIDTSGMTEIPPVCRKRAKKRAKKLSHNR